MKTQRPKTTGDTLSVYWGEFLVSPIPLELSFNYCSHKCAVCCSVDQPVMMADLRCKPGGEIVVGDALLGWKRGPLLSHAPAGMHGVTESAHRVWEKTVVTRVFHRKAEVLRVYLANGEEVICTPDHHWFTGRGGAIEYAPILTPNGKVRQGRNLHRIDLPLLPHQSFSRDYMIGYVRGVMEGDGCWMPQKTWRLAMSDDEPLARVASFLLLLGVGHFDARPYPRRLNDPEHWKPMQQLIFPVGSSANDLINGCDIESNEYWRGWLAGIYDAEGNTPARLNRKTPTALRIAQKKTVNLLTYNRIERALRLAGFGTVAEPKGVRVAGGRLEAARFTQYVQPSIERKLNPLLGSTMKGVEHPHMVVGFERIGQADVASFETETHNYVSGGFLSRNCFANLGKPDRWADVNATMRLLADYRNRETPVARYLQQGYPVLISNRTDPFAASNYQQAVPVIRLMAELGIPMAFQTRGGRGIEDVLSVIQPSAWYVSISQADDKLRAQLEPGAPSITERLKLVETLTHLGHHVSLALNPLVPEWLPDPTSILEDAYNAGARGVWIEHLHLNPKQIVNLTVKERDGLTEPIINRAQKRTRSDAEMGHFHAALNTARAIGYEVFSIGQPIRSDYFAPYRRIYPQTFPVMQDFINWCHDRGDTDSLIDFAQFSSLMLPRLPKGRLNIGHYLGATAHNIWATHDISNWMTFTELLALIWRDYRAKQNPLRIPCFAFAAERENDEWIEWLDDNDLPFVLFDPAGFDDFYC